MLIHRNKNGGINVNKRRSIVVFSFITAFFLMSGGYGIWKKEVVIDGTIEIKRVEGLGTIALASQGGAVTIPELPITVGNQQGENGQTTGTIEEVPVGSIDETLESIPDKKIIEEVNMQDPTLPPDLNHGDGQGADIIPGTSDDSETENTGDVVGEEQPEASETNDIDTSHNGDGDEKSGSSEASDPNDGADSSGGIDSDSGDESSSSDSSGSSGDSDSDGSADSSGDEDSSGGIDSDSGDESGSSDSSGSSDDSDSDGGADSSGDADSGGGIDSDSGDESGSSDDSDSDGGADSSDDADSGDDSSAEN
jgi:hypothetical protein